MLTYIWYGILIYFGIMFFGLLILGWVNRYEGHHYDVESYQARLEKIKQGR